MEFISENTPYRALRNGAAPGGPTVCVSCGTGALSSLFVVRHTCTHVSLVVPPTFLNVTFFPMSCHSDRSDNLH